MPLSIGIVGLPNVGKSTLFNALTKNQAPAENFPFCTIEPNVGLVNVPDQRLDKIAAISQPKKITPTAIKFIDIAGLVKGAHQGEGLGNQFLAHIRECDAICEVIRAFADKNVAHINGQINPEADRQTIDLELILADWQTVEKYLSKIKKEAKSGDKKLLDKIKFLEKVSAHLKQAKPLRTLNLSSQEKNSLKSLNLLSLKPIIYVLNAEPEKNNIKLPGWAGQQVLLLNAKLEAEIAGLPAAEQAEFRREFKIENGLARLIRRAYELLGLITFFTTGPEETRAWTVPAKTPAPQAAGKIHSDFERGFIRAEVIGWQDFIKVGGETAAREKGLLRSEGKNYLIQDGDICRFLFNI